MELFVSFSEIMHFFKRNKFKFILVVLAFGVVCGLLPLKLVQYSYTANTTLALTCQLSDNASSDDRLQYPGILGSRVQATVALAGSNDLIEKTADKLGIDKAEISKITGEQLNGSPVVKLTVQTTNGDKAAQISDTAAQILGDEITQQFPSPKITATVTDKALAGKSQSKKAAMVKTGALGLVLGFIIYVCFGIICVLSDRSVRNSRFAEEAMKSKLLGEIPHDNRGTNKEDAFRKMRAAAFHQFGSIKNFLVASASENDQGEEAAAGFAVSLSQAGKKVLVVDANLRSPKLADIFNVKSDKTLVDVLNGSCPLQQAAVEVSQHPGLSLISGVQHSEESPADLFAKNFQKFSSEAGELYDYVIVYAPSETNYPDADSVAVSTQAVIMTARYGSTTYGTLKESFRAMEAAGGKIIGFVITDA